MSPLPAACSHCGQPFDDQRHRLALLERRQALCALCVWFVEHPESSRLSRAEGRRLSAA